MKKVHVVDLLKYSLFTKRHTGQSMCVLVLGKSNCVPYMFAKANVSFMYVMCVIEFQRCRQFCAWLVGVEFAALNAVKLCS